MKQRAAFISTLFAIFLFVLPVVSTKVNAAWFMQTPSEYVQTLLKAESSNELQKEGYDFSTGHNSLQEWNLRLGGCRDCPPSSALHSSKSALAGINTYILAMYLNPPATSYIAIRDLGQTLGFIPKQVYAQGTGFTGLQPLLLLWKSFRNIAYVLLALVMIFIGFMVMFRKKIDPKTVVTVQNALPRIVITLLLITFSYAIAGLLIDLMYLMIVLVLAVIGSSGIQGVSATSLQQDYLKAGFPTLVGKVFDPALDMLGIGKGTGSSLSGWAKLGLNIAVPGGTIGIDAITKLFQGVGSLVGFPGASITRPASVSVLLSVIFGLALLFGFIRIFFMLISAYFQIIIAIIIGPLQILLGAIPGSNGFSSWFTNLVSNLLTFPVVVILLALGGVISENIGKNMWTPPLLPVASDDILRSIIGVGLVLTIPNVVTSIKKAFKAQPALQVGLGSVAQPITGAYQTGMGALSQFYYTSQIASMFKKKPPHSPS